MKKVNSLLFICLLFFAFQGCKTQNAATASNGKKMKALIIDGQNNHAMWPKTTVMMKQYLEETGLFTVDVKRTAFTWKGDDLIAKFPITGVPQTTAMEKSKTDPNFQPDFSKYEVVVSNFGWNAADWPAATQKALEDYVSNGGGFVVVHAADNSFPKWLEFNKMIGLGGWGDRTEKDGPYVYYNDDNKLVRDDSPGKGGGHGPQHEFQIMVRNANHPITKGMPKMWLHVKDELYQQLRGPAENMEVIATAYADAKYKGTARHEPMMMTLSYGNGRVFHTPMGHDDNSVACVGFITTFKRGVEWAATNKVTQKIPADFPSANAVSKRAVVLK